MSEVYLIRHAQAFINLGNSKYGDKESPLTVRGKQQAERLKLKLAVDYGLEIDTYSEPVLASTYQRPQETAKELGFSTIKISGLIDEVDVKKHSQSGKSIVRRHQKERWVPDEALARASVLLDHIEQGKKKYELYFSHGFFIAAVLLVCELRGVKLPIPFDEDRGYVPLQADVIKLSL